MDIDYNVGSVKFYFMPVYYLLRLSVFIRTVKFGSSMNAYVMIVNILDGLAGSFKEET